MDSDNSKTCFFSWTSREALRPTQPPIQREPLTLSSGLKRRGTWGWPLTSIQSKVKNKWSYTFIHRTRLRGMRGGTYLYLYGIKFELALLKTHWIKECGHQRNLIRRKFWAPSCLSPILRELYNKRYYNWFSACSQNCEKRISAWCPSVRPHWTIWLPMNGLSWNLISEYFFESLSRKFKFHKKPTRITCSLLDDQYTFM
jgi:hypothetical protein